jgi:hypothetical protein
LSWLSKRTGRPKEQGGHKRVNVSISKQTLEVLEQIKRKYGDVNLSQLVEILIEFYPELEENTKEMLNFTLETLLDMLSKLGKF